MSEFTFSLSRIEKASLTCPRVHSSSLQPTGHPSTSKGSNQKQVLSAQLNPIIRPDDTTGSVHINHF